MQVRGLVNWVVGVLVVAATSAEAGRKQKQEVSPYSDINPFDQHEIPALKLAIPFLDKHSSSRFYDFGGSTFIKSDSYIRLTADSQDQRGWIASNRLLPEQFLLEMEFQIHGHGNSMYGDGMALWMLKEPPREAGGVFGLKDYFDGSAIAIDTYKNNGPGRIFPYLQLLRGDGQTRYDQENDGRANEVAGWSVRGIHNAKALSKMRLTYVRGKFLSVEMDYRGRGKYEKCFEVEDYDLGDTAYLALSAQTGELSENHDIHSLHVYQLAKPPRGFADVDYHFNGNKNARYDPNSRNTASTNRKSSYETSEGGFFAGVWALIKLIFKMILFGAVLYAGYVGYRAWRRNQKSKRYDSALYL